MSYGYEMTIVTDYNGIGKIQYLLARRGIPVGESEYAEQVTVRVMIPYEEKKAVTNEITEATAGKAKITVGEPAYYKKE